MTIENYTIKKGQIWKNKSNGKQFVIVCKARGGRWKAHELTAKTNHFASTHSFLPFILRQKFELL